MRDMIDREDIKEKEEKIMTKKIDTEERKKNIEEESILNQEMKVIIKEKKKEYILNQQLIEKLKI